MIQAAAITDSLAQLGAADVASKMLYWERLQGISAVVVALLATSSVISIVYTRWGLVSQAKRERVVDAVERCEEMREQIIPLIDSLAANFAKNKVVVFERSVGRIVFPKEIDDAKAEKAVAWVKKLDPEGRALSLKVLNQLETWAIHFTHDLADPDVAYTPCATIYCTIVLMLYASIITQRYRDPNSGPYENVISLYHRWYKKQRLEKIQAEVEKLQHDGVFGAPVKP